jgi:hypothetical protein
MMSFVLIDRWRDAGAVSERTESIEHFLEYALAQELGNARRLADVDDTVVAKIAEQDQNDTLGEIEVGGDLLGVAIVFSGAGRGRSPRAGPGP